MLNLATLPHSPEGNKYVSKIWCNTQAEKDQICYTWTIKDFSIYKDKMGEVLKSSTFPVGATDNFKWCLDLYPRGNCEKSKDFVSLFLRLHSSPTAEVRIKFKMSILNAEKKEVNVLKSINRFGHSVTHGWPKFIRRDLLLLEGLSSEDTLTIVCEIGVLLDIVNICDSNKSAQFKIPESSLIHDFRNLFDNSKLSDLTITVDGHDFQAHKSILAARSVVFAAMFEYEMEESKLNRVAITDVDHEVFKEILHFIYTDKASNLDQMAVDLLAAADKYALERLKIMCEESLRASLSIETAAETLILADRHSAVQLKAYTRKFINKHFTDIMETEGWKNMIKAQLETLEINEC